MSNFDELVDNLMLDPLFRYMPRFYVEKFVRENPNWPNEYRENHRRHEAERAEARRQDNLELAPLLTDLEAIGRLTPPNENWPRGFILRNPDAETYAVLLKWFSHMSLWRVRNTVAMKLDRPEAANWIPELIALYRTVDTDDPDGGTNYQLSSAVARYAGPNHLNLLLNVCNDPTIGKTKAPLFGCLWKFNDDPRVFPFLLKTINETDVTPVVEDTLYSLRRIGDPSTRHIFERYLDHEDKDIRRYAREGIAKVDKALAKQEGRTIPPKPVKKRPPKQLRPWPHDLPHDALVTLMLADLLKLEDLAGLSERELLDFPGVGPATIARIKQELGDHNLPPLAE